MYFSKEFIISLYKKLSSLYPKDDIEQQGGTQFVSEIKYFLATDYYKKQKGNACNTNMKEDKEFFVNSVGKIVLLSDDGSFLATKNFANSIGNAKDFDVGSNFFSANSVAKSKITTEPQKFPNRHPQLLSITKGVVDIYSKGYENLSNNEEYLGGIIKNYALLFLWLNRFTAFNSINSIYNDSIYNLKESFSSELILNLRWKSQEVKQEIEKLIEDVQLVESKPNFKREDFMIHKESIKMNKISHPHNRITFGAPGTGKSFQLNEDAKFFGTNFERVTFHPNYSYAQFVGTYKPVQDSSDEKQITYQYVPGPFMRIYAAAKQNPNNNYLLLIEEINRANVAAVFGDVFQLLDRNSDGESEYKVAASEDIKKYLAKKGIYEDELSIPSNMYIWATMNSADQGVFPMDTAFKRRWEFEYIGIDDNEDKVKDYEIPINSNQKVNWNELRKAINTRLIEMSINEDKLLGPFFLSKTVLENASDNPEKFVKLFKSKVIMYLFEDAAKMKVKQLFKIDNNKYIFSEICKQIDEKGLDVFQIDTSNIKLSEVDNTKEDVVVSEGNTGTPSLFEQ